MKTRWSVLFCAALATMIGVSWMSQRFGMGMSEWLGIQLVGMIAAVVVAGWAMITAYPRKWPAAVVLICAAPMGKLVAGVGRHLGEFLAFMGIPGVLLFAGTTVTLIAAVVVLGMAPPRPPVDDPVARAKALRVTR